MLENIIYKLKNAIVLIQSMKKKIRKFTRDNKGKIIGVFTAVVAYLAGDGTFSSIFQAVWSSIFNL